MAALSAKKYDPQIKEYYERKVNEGKNKMLVFKRGPMQTHQPRFCCHPKKLTLR